MVSKVNCCHGLLVFCPTIFHHVSLNGSFSSWQPVSSGVPQGSALGPLLFVICINDTSSIVFSYLFKFADDAKSLLLNFESI